MKVHLIKRQTVVAYTQANSQSKTAFTKWLAVLELANWERPNDMFSTFNSLDILGNSSKRVVFNVGGNKYRLICKYHFGKTRVHLFVKWIGTHAKYSQLCMEGKQYTANDY